MQRVLSRIVSDEIHAGAPAVTSMAPIRLAIQRATSPNAMQASPSDASPLSMPDTPQRSCAQPSKTVMYTTGTLPKEAKMAYLVDALPYRSHRR